MEHCITLQDIELNDIVSWYIVLCYDFVLCCIAQHCNALRRIGYHIMLSYRVHARLASSFGRFDIFPSPCIASRFSDTPAWPTCAPFHSCAIFSRPLVCRPIARALPGVADRPRQHPDPQGPVPSSNPLPGCDRAPRVLLLLLIPWLQSLWPLHLLPPRPSP